jgi:hypothetical protein
VAYSQQQQQQQSMLSASGAAADGRRSLTTVGSGRWAGQLQPAVPPLQLQPAAAVASNSNISSRPASPAAAAAAVVEAGFTGGDCSGDAELPEVLAVLFDSSKQLVITAGNSGVIRVSGMVTAAGCTACAVNHAKAAQGTQAHSAGVVAQTWF